MAFIASGSAASHCLIADVNGVPYVWGRNEKGQLGLGDTFNRNEPTVISSLKDVKITGGACGRHHTIFITANGEGYACGLNNNGQCGTGNIKKGKGVEDTLLTPQLSAVSKCVKASCGAEFTMWMCDGKLYSAGLPQYGQLGHGDDHQYNASDSSIKMVFDPQPTPKMIATLANKTVCNVACGHNHTIALCTDGTVITWGFGGYGRLGHKVQQDEFAPRVVETLTGRVTVPADAVVAAGGTSSWCTTVGGQLFAWGKLKNSGDSWMYPTPFYDLAGWDLKDMSCGSQTYAISASLEGEPSVITWGQAQYGELGYGVGGRKTSANPEKCEALDAVKCQQVAMGFGHTVFLVDPNNPKAQSAPVWEPKEAIDPVQTASAVAGATGSKRKAPGPPKGANKKKAAAAVDAGGDGGDADYVA